MEPIPDDEWRAKLSPEEYRVLREHGTEAPFSGTYLTTNESGMYRCKACGAELFSSDAKYDSGSGWPSFTDPAVAENIGTRKDLSFGMVRTEVFCKTCGGHLGHVFETGEGASKKQYCINSICLQFDPMQKSPGETAEG